MRILFLLDNGLSAPSAMVRALQYRDLLAARKDVVADFRNHRSPLLDRLAVALARSGILRPLLGPVRKLDRLVTRLREGGLVRAARGYDIIYLVKVPSLRLYRKLAAQRGPRLYMDVNDGLWLPAYHGGGWERLDDMLRLVDAAVCENRYVAAYVARFCRQVHVVHDPPQVEVFDAWRGRVARDPGRVVIGWIGGVNSSDPLFLLFETLEKLSAKHPNLHVRIVGADPARLPRFEKVRYSVRRDYDQAAMAREVLAMDIGLFPLFDVEDALVRGTLKAMIYMSGEAVAACRNLGENRDLIQDGVNGVLAETPAEWFEKLDRLILDAGERRRMAAAGLETIRRGFTRERCLEQLLEAFRTRPAGAATR